MNCLSIPELVEDFFCQLGERHQDIYNEISLQLELGIFLRSKLQDRNHPTRRVQFERHVKDFALRYSEFEKREMDISIVENGSLVATIELKFPTNGQVPEQRFKFCEDIRFSEQICQFSDCSAYVLILVEDPKFYSLSPRLMGKGIYSFFRCGASLTGPIEKPTGKKDKTIVLNGNYKIEWNRIKDTHRRYTLIKAT